MVALFASAFRVVSQTYLSQLLATSSDRVQTCVVWAERLVAGLFISTVLLLLLEARADGRSLTLGSAVVDAVRRFPDVLVAYATALVGIVSGVWRWFVPGIIRWATYATVVPVQLFEKPPIPTLRCVALGYGYTGSLLALRGLQIASYVVGGIWVNLVFALLVRPHVLATVGPIPIAVAAGSLSQLLSAYFDGVFLAAYFGFRVVERVREKSDAAPVPTAQP